MEKNSLNTNGFSVIELLIIVFILAIIGISAFVVVKHNNHKTSTSSGTTISSANNTKGADIYSNWKSYCDSTSKFCFKYPANWTLSNGSNPTAGILQTLENTSSTVSLQYFNALPAIGEPTTVNTSNPLSSNAVPSNITVNIGSTYGFYVSAMNNLASNNSTYKIVSGYYTSASENVPTIIIMDIATINKLAIKIGQVNNLPSDAFNLNSALQPSNIIMFGGGPISNNSYSATEANAWLGSSDGQATLQVIQSFYSE